MSKQVRFFGAGLATSPRNPKTMVFYLALVLALVDLPRLSGVGSLGFEVALAAVDASALCAYVVLAARARRLVRSSRAVRRLNGVTGTVMAGATVLVATRH